MLKRTFDPWLPHRYVVYARMSSDQQNPRSPEQQFETVGRLIERLGRPWVHVADYRDDGISGRLSRQEAGVPADAGRHPLRRRGGRPDPGRHA